MLSLAVFVFCWTFSEEEIVGSYTCVADAAGKNSGLSGASDVACQSANAQPKILGPILVSLLVYIFIAGKWSLISNLRLNF